VNKLIYAFLLLLDVAAIGMMSYGAYLIYEPSGYIVVGGLIWLEINLNVSKESARTSGA